MMSVLGKWTAKGLPRPAYSNASGSVRFLILSVRNTSTWKLRIAKPVLGRLKTDLRKHLINSLKFGNTKYFKYKTKCFDTFPNTENRFEHTSRRAVFFEVFANLRKHSVEVWIYLDKGN